MLNAKTIISTLSLILLSVPAMAADTTKVYSSGILVLLCPAGCCSTSPSGFELSRHDQKRCKQRVKQEIANCWGQEIAGSP